MLDRDGEGLEQVDDRLLLDEHARLPLVLGYVCGPDGHCGYSRCQLM
jgi:hypothetical protein